MTVPAGTYIAEMVIPPMSGVNGFVRLDGIARNADTILELAQYASKTVVFTVAESTTLSIGSEVAGGTCGGYGWGGLRLVRIA